MLSTYSIPFSEAFWGALGTGLAIVITFAAIGAVVCFVFLVLAAGNNNQGCDGNSEGQPCDDIDAKKAAHPLTSLQLQLRNSLLLGTVGLAVDEKLKLFVAEPSEAVIPLREEEGANPFGGFHYPTSNWPIPLTATRVSSLLSAAANGTYMPGDQVLNSAK